MVQKKRDLAPASRRRFLALAGSTLASLMVGFAAARCNVLPPGSVAAEAVTPSSTLSILVFTELPRLVPTASTTPTPIPGESTSTPVPAGSATPAASGSLPETIDDRGVEMILVPEGSFSMGSLNGDPDEVPVRPVYLDAYYIDKFEVTNALYQDCVEAGACQPPSRDDSFIQRSYYGNSQYDAYPVVYVDWNMANAYCAWRGASLPTEAQWEKAARGTDERIFPWGREMDCQKANSQGCVNGTSPVGSYESGKSPYGVYEMAGNVWEWVADWYSAKYYETAPSSNPLGPDSGGARVMRGGSWSRPPHNLRVSNRVNYAPTYNNFDVGFRCARSLP